MSVKPLPFHAPHQGVPMVGQPFTILSVGVPMNAQLKCNCGGADTTVTIMQSVAAVCPCCGKVYNALFNPQNGQIQIQVGLPSAEESKVPS